uniref:NADH dehydrogenase subunit 4L n=1 Tax=Rhodobothrium cf. paucitesticulare DJM-2021 TaxID=2899513 RepID=A0A8K1SXR0_9CEST|nr:NADH dehydrogenase subunit 4L [Rhodobothrium cf. paucitesticulare DJM-2021]UFQ89109.1 NADH dehydrogenase subunit 4L [Rhodobothrium cf. paucitesticulare DJM-2021]
MTFLFVLLFVTILLSFFLSLSRFLNCLIILENFNVLLLLFILLSSLLDNHIMFIVLMVVSTVEVIIGLVVLTRVWESSNSLEVLSF